MAERMNVHAKCLRYRGFFQWVILGLLVIVIVHFGVRDYYPSLLGSKIENIKETMVEFKGKLLERPPVNDNAQPQEPAKPQRWQKEVEEPEKKPEETLQKLEQNPPPPQQEERQRAQENTQVEQKPAENPAEKKETDANQNQAQGTETKQATGDQPQQQQKQQQPQQQQQATGDQPQQQQQQKQATGDQAQQQQQQVVPKEGQNPAAQNTVPKYPFRDVTKSWEERVDDLVNRLTIEQVINQSQAFPEEPTPAIQSLGLKPFVWRGNCIHGLHGSVGTSYPQALGLAATFCTDLVHNVSLTISYEARAHWNRNLQKNDFRTMQGVTCFSPTINIFRHPLWGRNQETYGEDPYLTSKMAEAFVQGLQGKHERYIRVGAACKHFAAHSGPEHNPVSRLKFDAAVPEGDMKMTYLPAFKACVDAGAVGVMCSYNKINGVPACANKNLLTGTLRDLWKFKGFVVSDAGAIDYMRTEHKFRETKWDTVAEAIIAGVNLELATKKHAINHNLRIALEKKIITEKQLRESIKPLFLTRMKLGEFDPPEMNPYTKVNMSVVQRERHRNLATKVASASFVLLKNLNNTLPIKSEGNNKGILVLGPVADSADHMNGAYGPHTHPKYAQKPLLGLQRLSNNVRYEKACVDMECTSYDEEKVTQAVKEADFIIFTMIGVTETEFLDRTALSPPGKYVELIQKLPQWTKVPTILLLFSGAPVQLQWAQDSGNIMAIMQCFLPGQSAGDAIFNSLTGKTPDDVPAGRLPFTWPKSMDQIPAMTDYHMQGRTYRYSKGEPLYPFGYGLSYTKFQYESVVVEPKSVDPTKSFSVTVTVKNIGALAADEVVQVYIAWTEASLPSLPKLQLLAFRRVQIQPTKSEIMKFEIPGPQLMVWVDKDTGFKALPGKMKLFAGGQQPNQMMSVGSNVLETDFTIIQTS